MIINNNIQAVAGVYANNNKIKTTPTDEKTEGIMKKDELVLSTQAQSFSQILRKAQSMPEVRQEKVDTYTAQIGSGQYSVDPQLLAGKILSTRY